MLYFAIPFVLVLQAVAFQVPASWLVDPARWQDAPQKRSPLVLLGEEDQNSAQGQHSLEEVVGLCEQRVARCSEDGVDCREAEKEVDDSDDNKTSPALSLLCKSACGGTMQASCVGQITLSQHQWCQRLGDICTFFRTPQTGVQAPAVTHVADAAGLRQLNGARVASAQAQLAHSSPIQPLTFMHIPKTGGTLIEKLAESANISWGMNFLQGQEQMSTSGPWTWTCNAYHAPPQYLRDASVYQNSEVFCVTRHPYDRAVSEYTYLNAVPWGSQELPTGSKPCTPANLNSFLRHKLGQFRRAPHMKFINDCHFLPQSEYIWGDDGRQWCQHVLRLEDFPGEFNALMQRKGYTMKLTKAAKTSAKANSFHNSCPGLSSHDLGEPTRLLLDEVYAKDFENLGYLHEVTPEPTSRHSWIPTMPLLHLPPFVPLPFLHKVSKYFRSLLPAGMRHNRFTSSSQASALQVQERHKSHTGFQVHHEQQKQADDEPYS